MTEHAIGLTSLRLDPEGFRRAILGKLIYQVGKDPQHATRHDWFFALALAVRDRLVDGWMTTTRTVYDADRKRVYYLSLEFLIGRLLADSLRNLGLYETAARGHGRARRRCRGRCSRSSRTRPWAMAASAGSPPACSTAWRPSASPPTATASATSTACSSRASTTAGRSSGPRTGWPSAIPGSSSAPEAVYPVRLYGHVREERDAAGQRVQVWEGGQRVLAVAYDTPVVGWGGRHVNTLRLWSAQSGNLIDLEAFNRGDYMRAVQDQMLSQSISRVLYPNDATEAGQELRLKQEYFFTSASLQDIIRRHLSHHPDLRTLPDKAAIQLNDTHPAIAVPELMRLLIDEHGVDWDTAWTITRGTIHYTNHTLMPEALERWSVRADGAAAAAAAAADLRDQRPRPGRAAHAARQSATRSSADVSLIDESYGRFVRMGHLAFLGARKVNGVSALHGELMKQTVFRTLHRLFPDRITAITNGVTPRRWVLDCNPELAELITETLGHHALDRRSRAARGACPARRPIPPSGRASPRSSGPTRSGSRASSPGGTTSRCRPTRCSTCRSSASTSTSASCSTSWRRSRPTPTCSTARDAGSVAAGQDLRRQGGALLHARQADHQVHQRRRRAW